MTLVPDILQHSQLRDVKANWRVPILFRKIEKDLDRNFSTDEAYIDMDLKPKDPFKEAFTYCCTSSKNSFQVKEIICLKQIIAGLAG